VKDSFECFTKLHRLGRGQANCLFVNLVEGEIVDQPWATVALGNSPQWGETKVGKVLDRFERQDGPKGFVVEVRHFVADKVNVCFCRLMWATRGAVLYRSLSPVLVLHANWSAIGAQVIQKLGCGMINGTHIWMKV
jgi:hypothetical protein